MRTAPAVTVMARPGGWARAVLRLLAALAIAVTSVWAMPRGDAVAWIAMVLVMVGVAWLLWQDRREPVRRLRWDGAMWWLGAGTAEPQPGRVAVALDLDAFLLLRFRADAPAAGRRTHWLALQRRGLEADWHALRCAVYSPAAASGDTMAERA